MLAGAKLQPLVATARAEASKAFYQDLLGLRLVQEDAFALVFAGAEGDLRVTQAPAVMPSTYAVLSFVIDDIATILAALAARGVRFERFAFLQQDKDGVWTAPDHTMVAWFRDPDGNLLSLTQYPE